MATFKIKVSTLEGKILIKELEAIDAAEAKSSIEKQGLIPIEIRSKGFNNLSWGHKVSNSELLVFNQGLLALLKAGLSLVEAIETLKVNRNRAFSVVLEEILRDIRSGKAFSEALGKHTAIFSSLHISTIAAGERTGDLAPSIKGYIDFQKRMEAVRKKVISSSTYPLILAGASLFVVLLLLIYVVPSFARIYTDSGTELPSATKVLMGISDFVMEKFFILLIFISGMLFAFGYFFKTLRGKSIIDKLKLSIPEMGEIYMGYSISKFSRTMAMLLKSGLPLIEAFQMSKGVLNNSILQEKLDSVIKAVKEGDSASEAVARAEFMPEITLRMFKVGERSASLHIMCEEIAEFHDQEVEHRVEILTNLIEPALMIIMGLIIGAIIVLMYMPIFQLGSRI